MHSRVTHISLGFYIFLKKEIVGGVSSIKRTKTLAANPKNLKVRMLHPFDIKRSVVPPMGTFFFPVDPLF